MDSKKKTKSAAPKTGTMNEKNETRKGTASKSSNTKGHSSMKK